jgi:3-oxoacyl-[acyl-carrier-protein] synthase III
MSWLRALGFYVPAGIVTSRDLAPRVGVAPAWLLDATGIEERRFAAPGESVAELGVLAARDCLGSSGMAPREIGCLLVASGSAEKRFPGPAAAIGAALGIPGVPAIDLPMASAGSLFAIVLAAQLAPAHRNVLVVGAEIMSRLLQIDAAGRDTAILFGDGAGACVVSSETGFAEIRDSLLASDAGYADALSLSWGAPLYMDGRTVILHASRKLPRTISELLERNGLEVGDIGTYLLHQANRNLITRIAQTLKVPEERFFSNLNRYGNTSSASLLIAAAEWWRSSGGAMAAPVVLAAFGAGFHWGAVLAEPARM